MAIEPRKVAFRMRRTSSMRRPMKRVLYSRWLENTASHTGSMTAASTTKPTSSPGLSSPNSLPPSGTLRAVAAATIARSASPRASFGSTLGRVVACVPPY